MKYVPNTWLKGSFFDCAIAKEKFVILSIEMLLSCIHNITQRCEPWEYNNDMWEA